MGIEILMAMKAEIFFSGRWAVQINPYPANVENMVSSKECQKMADGI